MFKGCPLQGGWGSKDLQLGSGSMTTAETDRVASAKERIQALREAVGTASPERLAALRSVIEPGATRDTSSLQDGPLPVGFTSWEQWSQFRQIQ